MSFNSLQFLIFLPLVVLIYWLLPKKARWAFLLIASYYFYMSWNPWLIFLIIGTTLVSYFAAILMEKAKTPGIKKLMFAIAIILCLGVLIFFKYFNFLIQSVIDILNLFSLHLESFSLDIILPIGISFYTIQVLSYLIDAYKGTFPAEKHLGYYALFVCFFPQLVAGPIERPGDLIPQLRADHKFSLDDLLIGLRILLVGFFYKVVIADFVGIYINNVLYNLGEANTLSIFLAGFLFTVQMFCDFAGYSEIATGAARMMGIRLSRNFDRPYMCNSYTDFFRRWHMTLGRWLTDYIYIPLGGNKKGKGRRILNTYIIFLISGLWHGAGWTYLFWGIYAATIMTIEGLAIRPFEKFLFARGVNTKGKAWNAMKVFLTYFITIPGALLFRSDDLAHAGEIFSGLFTKWGFGLDYFKASFGNLGLDWMLVIVILLAIVCEWLIHHFGELGRENPIGEPLPEGALTKTQSASNLVLIVYLITVIGIAWVALLSSGSMSAFQYFQF